MKTNCKEVIVTFEEAEITLNIDPDEGENVGGWNITPLVHPVVSLYCVATAGKILNIQQVEKQQVDETKSDSCQLAKEAVTPHQWPPAYNPCTDRRMGDHDS